MDCNEGGGGGSTKTEERREALVYTWGYLPGVSPVKSPIVSLSPVRFPNRMEGGYSWKDVCGGGCGFAMAISECGKLMTWGSTDDEGQSYVISGKHGGTPEAYPLPTEASILKAAAGWAHCVAVTETGEVYTWGWKECVPSGNLIGDLGMVEHLQKDTTGNQSSLPAEQVKSMPQGFNLTGGTVSHLDSKRAREEIAKRRKISSAKVESESSTGGKEFFNPSPCLVTLGPGVRITTVAAGGRHTLALSDAGALLTFGWGLYGQCGQGNTIDQLRPSYVKSLSETKVKNIAAGLWHTLCVSVDGHVYAFGGNQFGQLGTGADEGETLPKILDSPGLGSKHTKVASCGARHSVILTEDGQLFSWGWNKYGQLGLGDSVDRNIPSQVSIEGCLTKNIACGWWHTLLLAERPI
ncbi:ultraviolet-B receptor UVR8-like isoform X2 [Pyrus communis]|uniref:ultraviolet-B receptor UVR8-like isoform X2 n=1 Tax=Pyrus communis TaxID=23211 RepID=UPI0035C07554